MKSKAVFYHGGCPGCVSAERMVAEAVDRSRFDLSIVHLGMDRGAIATAERAGVKSVPALVLDNQVFHINFGASLADVARG